MPGRNGTGPMGTGGTGAMSGRGNGNCAGRGQVAQGQGLGNGFGQGGGSRGGRRKCQVGARDLGLDAAPLSGLRQENQTLARHNAVLRSELDAAKKQLDEAESRAEKSK